MNRDSRTIEDLLEKLNSAQRRVLELRDDKDRLIEERDDARNRAFLLRRVAQINGETVGLFPWEREEALPGRPCSTCKRDLPDGWKYELCQKCGDDYEETSEDLHRADLEFDARRESW